MRENESAILLAKAGYLVEQNPSVPGSKKPDYKIQGQVIPQSVEIDQKTYPLLTSVAIRQGKSIKEIATEALDAYLQQAVAEK